MHQICHQVELPLLAA